MDLAGTEGPGLDLERGALGLEGAVPPAERRELLRRGSDGIESDGRVAVRDLAGRRPHEVEREDVALDPESHGLEADLVERLRHHAHLAVVLRPEEAVLVVPRARERPDPIAG